MKKKSATEQNRNLKQLLKAYEGLSSQQQSIVQVLSVVFTWTARTYLMNCLRKLKIRALDGKAYTLKTLDPFFDELAASGVIEIGYNYSIACNRMLARHVSRELFEQGRFDAIARVVKQYHPLQKTYGGKLYPRDYDQFIREIRIGVYCADADYVQRMFSENKDRFQYEIRKMHPYEVIFGDHPDAKWLAANLPGGLVADVLKPSLASAAIRLAPVDPEIFSLLQNLAKRSDKSDYSIDVLLAEQLILDGRLKQASRLLSNIETTESFALKGFCAFLAGSDQDAISHYETALKLLRKTTQKRKIYFKTLSGLFFIPALIRTGVTKHLHSAKKYAGIAKEDDANRFQDAYRSLYRLIELKTAVSGAAEDINTHWHKDVASKEFITFFEALCLFWTNRRGAREIKNTLKVLQKKAEQNGYGWIAAQSSELLSRLSEDDKTYKKKATAFWDKTGIKSMTDLVKMDPKWKRTIDALIRLKKPEALETETANSSRMVWLFSFSEKYGHWSISPREQRKNAKGIWSKGRRIALKRLYYERITFDFLTPQDMDVCSCLNEDSYIWHGYPEVSYYFNAGAMMALVGHPLVFWDDSPTVRVEIAKGDPELLVSKPVQGKIKISLSHEISIKNEIELVKESPTRIKVIEINNDVKNLAQILGKGVTVPETAREQVFKAINNISSIITVHSQIEGDISGVEEIAADPTLNIHLLPHGQGLTINVLVRPFSTGGPYFHPGEGAETIISEIDGKRMLARRDLAKETAFANKVVSGCPVLLTSEEYFQGEWEWRLDDPEDCLEVLLEFQSRGDEVVIAWPEAERFRIKQRVDINRFFMGIQKQNDWFSVSGELKLDDGLVMDMTHLFELMEKSPGRFVRLEDGRFLALTRTFQKRLEALKTWSEKSGKNRRFHPLAALPLDDLADELGGFRSDKHWKAHLKQFKDARELKPQVPSTFKAELRDYQVRGFNWLARLSHWGVGACLADDMGLGKTIQALAVLLKAAPKGPSLVVAPTSLLMNWEAEARRFAPTLNVVFFQNGNRDEILAGLQSFDMLVVSYGLLQQKKTADMLTGVPFQTIVLDEAQAIKNFTTKRSRAAMNLNGEFKLITTGTPLENHLGELWNLFRFINPGLLGSFARFNQNYAVPIEKYGDRKAQARLKKLVQPFILRRTKNQVLEELPERTDIILNVELSKQEIAFYEALRRRAMQKLDEAAKDRSKQMRVLAEIMKLRRACCNTRLVMPDQPLPSTKLAVFGDLLDELLASRHKALVFSQFVDHLHIIREFVQKRGLGYQYLDGGTTQKQRKKSVEAFQAGEGDLFLISLKAGGLGLNLTAADYVIHMDPWWNPAVEDQASDRAHRIGQKRPVTVYRLVAKHTIEEKIVELHHKKRELADGLLDGAEMSGKMSADELLRLIRHT